MAVDFRTFLKEREEASVAYINGDGGPFAKLLTTHDPASFMRPNGAVTTDAAEVAQAYADGAKMFAKGSTGRFEMLHAAHSGELGYWTGWQNAEVMAEGKDKPMPMVLRVTEIFRLEDGAWRLIHRHADMSPNRA